MTPESGLIEAEDRRARLVAVAGLLAELGVVSLELDGRALAARVTDLPALLSPLAPEERTIVARSVDLTVVLTSSAARWSTGRADTASAVRSGRASAP